MLNMKNVITPTYRQQLTQLKRELEITEKKLDYVTDPKLTAALSYELLGIRARIGYIIDAAKMSV